MDFPFKPEGEPASIQAMEPPQENILTAIAENTRILETGSDPARRGAALTWLFHLVGDVHQPLHAVQLFTREYPNGDCGAVISAFVLLRIVPHYRCIAFGMG